jgi:hypothetical protein
MQNKGNQHNDTQHNNNKLETQMLTVVYAVLQC